MMKGFHILDWQQHTCNVDGCGDEDDDDSDDNDDDDTDGDEGDHGLVV